MSFDLGLAGCHYSRYLHPKPITMADPLMRKIRYLDKLIDELTKGKVMAKILRQ
ncbi:DUF2200 family protein [Arsukibacterium tuosuense]|uniref:DUF2200 family protein n=1 Tax=Arsukibacterium tuosuense TaxID=1323745 RepID=UPI001FEC95D7|nr:DUF2200 family protein [Arsukibacterium tuosuense]